MTQNLPKPTPTQPTSNNRNTRTQVRADTEKMLRDLALVLKMTHVIRTEIEAEKEASNLVSV